MTLKVTKNFSKKRNKLVSSGNITNKDYDTTKDLFKSNPKDSRIRPHKINCQDNQTIISLAIVNSQYRILANYKECNKSFCIFSWIGSHREYERIVKDQRNCKQLFISCDEVEQL